MIFLRIDDYVDDYVLDDDDTDIHIYVTKRAQLCRTTIIDKSKWP